uniref:MlaD family protein n=1 Tax=Chitinophaga sp. TaxID=1869181 RepID=UPI0031D6DF5D
MLKASNETTIGILAAVAIAMLISGCDFLKGKNPAAHSKTIYVVYKGVNDLQPFIAVQVDGLVVGQVARLEVMDKHAGRTLLTLTIRKKIDIPRNSVARIASDVLGTKTVQIDFGNANDYLKDGDTIYAAPDGSVTDALNEQPNPLVQKQEGTPGSVASLLMTVNSIFDTTTKGNLREAIGHLNATMGNFTRTSASL